jgi:site-specific DNA-methyltransferase (cytosine-N4-specific)
MFEESSVCKLMASEPAYNTELGACFHGDSRDLLKELPRNSIDLVVTSPPFALQHQKEYGNEKLEDYNDWFMDFASEVQRVLQPHGSFVVEMGGAFERGVPKRSTYQFELLTRLTDDKEGRYELAQDFYWLNPAKLPNPIEWVNVRKIRVTDAVTHVWWLAKEINKDPAYTDELKEKVRIIEEILEQWTTNLDQQDLLKIVEAVLQGDDSEDDERYTHEVRELIADELPSLSEEIDAVISQSQKAPSVYANDVLDAVRRNDPVPRPRPKPEVNNQRVLQEYSDSQKELLESGKYNDGKRPSGWDIDPDSFANENEGSIPKNLIEASNTASNTHYLEMCRKFDFDSHPARFPRQIPEFFIEMLTPDPPYDEWDRGTLDRPIVLDIFAGSNLTGKVAETTDRYWLAFEEKERYVQTSEFRFRTEEQIRKQLDGSQSGLKGFDGPESS